MNIDSIGHSPLGHRATCSVAPEDVEVEPADIADAEPDVTLSIIQAAPLVREAAWVGEIRQLAVNTTKRKNPRDRDEELGPDEAELAAVADDRVLYLAMAAVTMPPPLRPTQARRAQLISAVRARSRAECKKRCGNAGNCDPENPLGCGGTYCREGNEPV